MVRLLVALALCTVAALAVKPKGEHKEVDSSGLTKAPAEGKQPDQKSVDESPERDQRPARTPGLLQPRFRQQYGSTNSKYRFPYWSQTTHWPGQELGKPTGACFVGLIPYMQVKKSPATATLGAAMSEKMQSMIGLGHGVECKSSLACADVTHCNGLISPGITLQPFCYESKGNNACACGVRADHIRGKELCGPGMVPPVAYADFKDKAKVKAKLDGQKMVVTSGKEDMDNSGTDVWWIQHAFPKLLQDFMGKQKRLPIWEASQTKSNGEFCIMAYLPYVKCGRQASTKMKNLAQLSFSCKRDSDCLCGSGCTGNSLTGDGQFRPVCLKKTGFNVCQCALSSSKPKTSKGCTWPTEHDKDVNGQKVELFYAELEAAGAPKKGAGWSMSSMFKFKGK